MPMFTDTFCLSLCSRHLSLTLAYPEPIWHSWVVLGDYYRLTCPAVYACPARKPTPAAHRGHISRFSTFFNSALARSSFSRVDCAVCIFSRSYTYPPQAQRRSRRHRYQKKTTAPARRHKIRCTDIPLSSTVCALPNSTGKEFCTARATFGERLPVEKPGKCKEARFRVRRGVRKQKKRGPVSR
jgi:hypothetical protein